MNQNTDKILNAIDNDPALLEQLLNMDEAPLTRSGQRANPLLSVVGNNVTNDDVETINRELSDNPIIQLYSAASGSLDAKDLLSYVGGTRATRANSDPAVRALFDGRLDLKDIMLIIVLLKLFKRKNSHTYNNSAIGLLGTLLGFNNSNSYNNAGSLFSTLLGGNNHYQQSYNLFGGNSGLFGSNNYGYNSYYGNNNGLGSFLGLTGNSGFSNNGLQNLLSFINGNYNNNPQYSLLYNILSQAAGNIVSGSGNVSAGGLFSVLNQLLK
ncbi:MAG: hypothetical protein IIY65_01430 [Erysipelotrichaceae bacterium]|nr:hypothetical protein [Erysipelotrichaceae bacterium]